MTEPTGIRGPSILKALLTGVAVLGIAFLIVIAIAMILLSMVGPLPFSDVGRTDGVYAQNRTDKDLHFRALLPSGWFNVPFVAEPYVGTYASNLLLLSPSQLDANRCTTGPIVALNEDGREVARHDDPICLDHGQALWVVKAAGPVSTD
jgi:hypothetical protein